MNAIAMVQEMEAELRKRGVVITDAHSTVMDVLTDLLHKSYVQGLRDGVAEIMTQPDSLVADVRAFMQLAEQTASPRQVSLQVGYCMEEMNETLDAMAPPQHSYVVDAMSKLFKSGGKDVVCKYGNQAAMLDGFLDLAWVAIGGALAMGANVEGAWNEIVRSNMSKINPLTLRMDRDENGKVIKPVGYSKPDLIPFLSTSINTEK